MDGDLSDRERRRRTGVPAEQQVASMYRAFGFHVDRDVHAQGRQVDVVAERHVQGVGRLRIFIEVKDHPGQPVPIAEVRDFSNAANLVVGSGQCDRYLLVTTGHFTRAGKDTVAPFPALGLRLFADLERELFDPIPTLQRWLSAYRERPINHSYVDLGTTLLDVEGPGDVEADGRPRATELFDVAKKNPSSGLVVFGDYGAGKTTTLERIKALAVEALADGGGTLVPLLLRLGRLTDLGDIEPFILRSAAAELGTSLEPEPLWDFIHKGRFLLLLDGFDEISLRVDPARRAELLRRISPLLFGASPAIVTTRPSYFASYEEYRQAVDRLRIDDGVAASASASAQRINDLTHRLVARHVQPDVPVPRHASAISYRLDPLTSGEIDRYLEQVNSDLEAVGTTARELRDFLDSIYDLSDLITRPIILEMAVVTTVEGHINPKKGTLADGPAGIYTAYTQAKVRIDWEKAESRQDLLSFEQRIDFAKASAVAMHRSESLNIPAASILQLAGRVDRANLDAATEEIITDLRTCSFLTTDEADGLRFIHRSFQEYFFARALVDALAARSTTLLEQPLRWEYLYFLGALAMTSSDVLLALTDLSRTPSAMGAPSSTTTAVGDNAATALLASRAQPTAVEWAGRTVAHAKRPDLAFSQATLTDVRLLSTDVPSVEFFDSRLDCILQGQRIDRVQASACQGQLTTEGTISRIEITGGNLTLTERSTARSISADSMGLTVKVEKKAPIDLHLRHVDGTVEVVAARLMSAGSTLRITRIDRVLRGQIESSVVQTDVKCFRALAASIVDSVLIVRGVERQTTRLDDIVKVGPRADAGFDSVGSRSVLFISPTVPTDSWWGYQEDLVIIGGRSPGPGSHWQGLAVDMKAIATKDPDRSFGRIVEVAEGALVLQGHGEAFATSVQRVQEFVDSTTTDGVRNRTSLVRRLRSLLRDLGATDGQGDRLWSLVDVRLPPSS